MEQPPKRYRVAEAAKIVGIHEETLKKWEKKGYIEGHRSPSGQRYYYREQLEKLYKDKPVEEDKV
jgi:excisionase family DNA binding protein